MRRRLSALVLICALMLALSGCIVITLDEYYELAYDTDQIESIGIYTCGDANVLSDEPLAVIDPDDFDTFVEELESLSFEKGMIITIAAVDPSFSFGDYTVQVVYTDGAIERISDFGYQEFQDAEGNERCSHYGLQNEEEWETFLNPYLSKE